MAANRETLWLNAWYGTRRWTYWFFPLAWLFRVLAVVRRFWLTRFVQQSPGVPVIVVGNITVGGTGKTPLLIALVEHLKDRGFVPGVISRGYGGSAPGYPFLLTPSATAAEVGDEPLNIFETTGCAVCVGPDRVASANYLQAQGCNILLSDDGLQHYRLGRTLEIAVVDGERGFGNGQCLPVGPLREPVARLSSVDMVVVNGETNASFPPEIKSRFTMTMLPAAWIRLTDQQKFPLPHLLPRTQVHAVAGIGNPQRFYRSLRALGLTPIEHDFPDHHVYAAHELKFSETSPLVMTTKDAVKCRAFAGDDWYSLIVNARLPDTFWTDFDARLATAIAARTSAKNA